MADTTVSTEIEKLQEVVASSEPEVGNVAASGSKEVQSIEKFDPKQDSPPTDVVVDEAKVKEDTAVLDSLEENTQTIEKLPPPTELATELTPDASETEPVRDLYYRRKLHLVEHPNEAPYLENRPIYLLFLNLSIYFIIILLVVAIFTNSGEPTIGALSAIGIFVLASYCCASYRQWEFSSSSWMTKSQAEKLLKESKETDPKYYGYFRFDLRNSFPKKFTVAKDSSIDLDFTKFSGRVTRVEVKKVFRMTNPEIAGDLESQKDLLIGRMHELRGFKKRERASVKYREVYDVPMLPDKIMFDPRGGDNAGRPWFYSPVIYCCCVFILCGGPWKHFINYFCSTKVTYKSVKDFSVQEEPENMTPSNEV